MSSSFDIIIAGLGAMGSAAAFHLSKRGCRVLGLDRFAPPHAFGSSHGQTRIIREAYFEDPLYVPLVRRAYELWAELEQQSGRALFKQTGGLMVGPPSGKLVSGARRSAETHQLDHQLLSAPDIHRRFPALQPPDDIAAVWEPRAGILFPEDCIESHLRLARQTGVEIHPEETVLNWRHAGPDLRVTTSKTAYTTSQLLLTAGGWIHSLLPGWKPPLTIERQVMFWFDPKVRPENFAPGKFPIHIWETHPDTFFYSFPNLGAGMKIAGHHHGAITHPDSLDRTVHPGETEAMREILRRFLPDADGPLRQAVVCIYTNTPDHHFWIDWHPEHPQVLICSPCSGHGFKFSSVIGEIAADLLSAQSPRFDLQLFGCRPNWF